MSPQLAKQQLRAAGHAGEADVLQKEGSRQSICGYFCSGEINSDHQPVGRTRAERVTASGKETDSVCVCSVSIAGSTQTFN